MNFLSKLLFSLLIILPTASHSLEEIIYESSFSNGNYPFIKSEVWDKVFPFLIPDNHPAKSILDKIFADPQTLSSLETMKKAGFEIVKFRNSRQMATAKHPKLKNYLIKMYSDNVVIAEWNSFIQRINGAHILQEYFNKNNLNSLFKTPKKCIYPVHRNKSKSEYTKHFVLLVEDMNIFNGQIQLKKYKTEITHPLLKALCKTLYEVGFNDCHLNNLPFSSDGKIAFIDTEFYNNWPILFHKLTPFLSPEMQKYWKKLIKDNK